MQKWIINVSICGLLLVTSGCWRGVDWAKSNFYQGTSLQHTISDVASYIKSVRIHDRLVVRATFDALWLSDEVRTAYVDVHALRYGMSHEHYNALLGKQLAENKQYISFYVLSTYEVPLDGEQAEWNLFLDINGQHFMPIELTVVDLVPEYRAFFGKNFNQFKLVYLVKFDARDSEGKPLITEDVDRMSMHFRSLYKEAQLIWWLKQ